MAKIETRRLMVWLAAKQFFLCWWRTAQTFGSDTPWYVRLVEVLWIAPLFAAYQSWAYFVLDPWNLSEKPCDWLYRLFDPAIGWAETKLIRRGIDEARRNEGEYV